jgi:hypothetical protein
MGSYPYPPNGMIEIDYEFILIFKKPGKSENVPKEVREKSRLTKEEWKEYFSGHWRFGGEKQINHEAMFPEELPRRLIRMYSLIGDVVLDPFLGSGTTIKAALELQRNGIGYEINEDFVKIINDKIGNNLLIELFDLEIVKRTQKIELDSIPYEPSVPDAKPLLDSRNLDLNRGKMYKVVNIVSEDIIELDTGLLVKFLGLDVVDKERAVKYLREYVLKKDVIIKVEENLLVSENTVFAYVYLKNKIFVNAYLIKSGIAQADKKKEYKLKKKFLEIENQRKYG